MTRVAFSELVSPVLMYRTPGGIEEDFEQGDWAQRRARRGGVVVKNRS